MDTGILARILDDVLEYGGDYRIESLDLGRQHEDESRALVEISADEADRLDRILMRVQVHGANPVDPGTATTRPAPADGVFPEDFYSTTNLDTFVRLDRDWLRVDRAEMDCGLVVEERDGRTVIRNVPVSDVQAGEAVVCGAHGVRVEMPPRRRPRRGGELRLHELGGVQREAAGAAGPSDRRADARGQGRRAEDPLGRRPGRGAHRRGPGDGPAGRAPATSTSSSPATRWPPTTSSRRCSARPSVSTWPRGRACRTGTSTTSGRSTRSARPGRSRGRGVRHPDRRGHARDGAGAASRSCWSARCATTARCPTSTPT